MIHVAPVIMLALLLAAIIITVNAIQRGKKRKMDDRKAFNDEWEKFEQWKRERKSRLSAEASDHDKEIPRGGGRVR